MTTALRVALVAAIACVLMWPLVARVVRHRFDPFEPIVLFAAAYGVMFVVRPSSMIAHDRIVYLGPRAATDVSATFTRMLLLALLGAVAFVAAYETGIGRRLAAGRRALADVTSRRVVVMAVTWGALAVALFIAFLVSTSGLSTVSLIFRGRTARLDHDIAGTSFYLWYSYSLLVPASFILVAVWRETGRRLPLLTGAVFGALFLLRTIPLGDRVAILPFVGGAFVLFYLMRDRRPSTAALVAVALVALVGASFLSDLRGRNTRRQDVAQTIVRSLHPSRIAAPFLTGPDSEMAPVLAAALSQIPAKLHYTYGRTIFVDLLTRPVPRTLWPEKPRPPTTKLVAKIWPAEKGTINPEFSVLLYFYWDFGIPGVILGMAVFGVVARGLFAYLLLYRRSTSVQLLYALALWFVVIGLRNSPVETFVQWAFVVIPAWLAVRPRSRTAGERLPAPVPQSQHRRALRS